LENGIEKKNSAGEALKFTISVLLDFVPLSALNKKVALSVFFYCIIPKNRKRNTNDSDTD
jgi:hypothetical protein